MPTFYIVCVRSTVCVHRGRDDAHASETIEGALAKALPDEGDAIEVSSIEAPDVESARLMYTTPLGPDLHTVLSKLTFGCFPDRGLFDALFAYYCPQGFRFGQDPRVGTCVLSADETWTALESARAEAEDIAGHPDCEAIEAWMSSVLGCLHIEWI